MLSSPVTPQFSKEKGVGLSIVHPTKQVRNVEWNFAKTGGTRAEDALGIVKDPGEDLRDMVRDWEKWHLKDTEHEHVCGRTASINWTLCILLAVRYCKKQNQAGVGCALIPLFGQSSSLPFFFFSCCCINTANTVPKSSPGPWDCTTDVPKQAELSCELLSSKYEQKTREGCSGCLSEWIVTRFKIWI